MKDKTCKNILSAFKKCIITFNFPTTLQTDNGTEFENNIMSQFDLREIFNIILELLIVSNTMVLYNRLQDSSRFFNTILVSLDYNSLDYSICDYLLYYNDRLHSTTKAARYKAIMDASDKELMEKKILNILKRILKAKTESETYPDGS